MVTFSQTKQHIICTSAAFSLHFNTLINFDVFDKQLIKNDSY